MNFREKIFTQLVICCIIFTAAKAGEIVQIPALDSLKERAKGNFTRNYTLEELRTAASDLFEKAKTAPTAVSTAVVSANKLGEFSQPIDEEGSSELNCVYATSSGEVISSGISKELGSFVRIRHDSSISTYGNLSTVKVVQGDYVKKGDIIATYDKKSEKKFYYDLEENLQS